MIFNSRGQRECICHPSRKAYILEIYSCVRLWAYNNSANVEYITHHPSPLSEARFRVFIRKLPSSASTSVFAGSCPTFIVNSNCISTDPLTPSSHNPLFTRISPQHQQEHHRLHDQHDPTLPYFQHTSSNELDDFALIDAWLPPSESPSYLRRIPRTSGVQVLSWLMCGSVAGLPPTTPPAQNIQLAARVQTQRSTVL